MMKTIQKTWEIQHPQTKKIWSVMAHYSEDMKYQYWIRAWQRDSTAFDPCIHYIGVNPSNNHPGKTSRTFTRLMSFSTELGYKDFTLVNIFPLINPDTRKLSFWKIPEDIIDLNCNYVMQAVESPCKVVCMWGSQVLTEKTPVAFNLLNAEHQNLYVLGINKDGTPKHPLFQPIGDELIRVTKVNGRHLEI